MATEIELEETSARLTEILFSLPPEVRGRVLSSLRSSYGLRQKEMAEDGPSERQLRRIEKGEKVLRRSLSRYNRALLHQAGAREGHTPQKVFHRFLVILQGNGEDETLREVARELMRIAEISGTMGSKLLAQSSFPPPPDKDP